MSTTSKDVATRIGLQDRSRPWRRALIVGLVLAALGGSGWFWLGPASDAQEARFVKESVARGGFDVIVTATGTVEPTNLVEISSEVSGTIAEVPVDYNDGVDEGTVLALLDTTKLEAELAVARAALDSAIARVAGARATLQEARERFETTRDLDARGIVTHQEFIIREAAFKRAQANLQTAEADQNLAEATLDLRRTDLERACICSPIRGVVLDRAVDPGQIVVAALQAPVLFTIAEDLTEMELQVDVDEADVGRVRVGQEATFIVDAYDDEVFPATISKLRFAPETVDGVVTYKAILTVDNTQMLLRPGMTATADIVVEKVENALVVPNSALRFQPRFEADSEGGERSGLLGMLIPESEQTAFDPRAARTVWVLDADGLPAEVQIEVGGSDGRMTEIRGGPLDEGDEVIVEQLDG